MKMMTKMTFLMKKVKKIWMMDMVMKQQMKGPKVMMKVIKMLRKPPEMGTLQMWICHQKRNRKYLKMIMQLKMGIKVQVQLYPLILQDKNHK